MGILSSLPDTLWKHFLLKKIVHNKDYITNLSVVSNNTDAGTDSGISHAGISSILLRTNLEAFLPQAITEISMLLDF